MIILLFIFSASLIALKLLEKRYRLYPDTLAFTGFCQVSLITPFLSDKAVRLVGLGGLDISRVTNIF